MRSEKENKKKRKIHTAIEKLQNNETKLVNE